MNGKNAYSAFAKRGGGERGLMDRGISRDCKSSATSTTETAAEVNATGGNTNATAVTSGFSEFWQHDIEQFIISPISCPQSISACGEACFFWW